MPDPGESYSNSGLCGCGSRLQYRNCCGLSEVQLPAYATVVELEPEYLAIERSWAAGELVSAEGKAIVLLNKAPCHARTLQILLRINQQQAKDRTVEVLLKRLVGLLPQNVQHASDLSMLLYSRGELVEAEAHARNLVRLAPDYSQGHNLMGMILTDTHKLQAGEYHYRRAIELHGPVGKLCANLGLNLKGQGKMDEANAMYQQAVELEPENMNSMMGWIKLKEADRKADEAWELLKNVEKGLSKGDAGLCMTRSVLLRRGKKFQEAFQALEAVNTEHVQGNPAYYFERGDVLDKLGCYDEAFESFERANTIIRSMAKREYAEDYASLQVRRLKGFFTRDRMDMLPRVTKDARDAATPLFIVGFPRSGTTLVEQVLTSLESVSAGDELPFVWDITEAMPKMLNSSLFYPECLADLWFGDNQAGLETLRDYYFRKVYQLNLIEPGARFFTDKMPLNETNMGLMQLVFPDSPIVHVLRHPLDVTLSCFFNDLTHGNNCSYSLVSAAKHYVLIRELLDHYLEQLDLNYFAIRYEDIVRDPEDRCRELLEWVGLDWNPICLEFHKNLRFARTASYAQVAEPLYASSVYRYKNYLPHLREVIPILAPVIEKLGYEVPEI